MQKTPSFSKSTFSSLVLALVFALGTVSCSGRNIHSDLKEDSNILLRQWTLSFGEKSVVDHGMDYSNPVLVENTLIFGTRSAGLVSIYPSLNQQRWVLPIPGGVVSELTVERGSVYFCGGDGFLYSVSTENGRVNWRYDLRNPIASRPTVSGGRLFLTTTDDTVYAFDAGTGKWLWHYRRRTSPAATIRGASAPLVDGAEVLAGLSDGFLVALSVSDGQLKWERKLHHGSKFTDVDASPVLESSVIYLPSYDGALYALKRQGADILWRFDAGGSKTVQIEDQRLYFSSSDGRVYALQKNNAKVLWSFELDHGTPTGLVITDRYIIVGSSFQYLYVLDKETGKGVYRLNIGYGSGFSGSPAYDKSNGWMYFLSGAGNLYSFTLARGQKPAAAK